MKWLDLVKFLAPLVMVSIPKAAKIAPIIPTIIDGIGEAQQIKGASGADKKAHVLNLVADAVGSLNGAGIGPKLDPAETQAIVSSAIDTTVGVINLVQAAHQAVPVGVLLPPTGATGV